MKLYEFRLRINRELDADFKIDDNNPQCMEFIKSMEKRVDRMEMEQGRSRSRRNATNEIVGWTMMVGFAIIIGWGIFTAIKSII